MIAHELTPQATSGPASTGKAKAARSCTRPAPSKVDQRPKEVLKDDWLASPTKRTPLAALPLLDDNRLHAELLPPQDLPHSQPPARKGGAARKPQALRVEASGEGEPEDVSGKRKRKTAHQLKALEAEFARHPHWTKEIVASVSGKTGLNEAQVYKWHWDQKRKRGAEDGEFCMPGTDEFGGYSKHGFSGFESITDALGINLDAKVEDLRLELSAQENGKFCKGTVKTYQKFKNLVSSNKENF